MPEKHMWDAFLAIGGFVIGVLGTIAAFVIAVRQRQFTRPKLQLMIGTARLFGLKDPKSFRKIDAEALAFGISRRKQSFTPVTCAFAVRNTGSLPISDVRIHLAYPADCLMDNAAFLHGDMMEVAVSQPNTQRTVTRLGSAALVDHEIPLIRPMETVVAAEVLRLVPTGGSHSEATGPIPGDRFCARFKDVPRFVAAQSVEVSVWSSSCLPVAKSVELLWFDTCNFPDTVDSIANAAEAAWDNRKLLPGVYWWPYVPFRKKKWKRKQFFEIAVPPANARTLKEMTSMESFVNTDFGAMWIEVPPWGLFGASYDVAKELGMVHIGRLNRHKKAQASTS